MWEPLSIAITLLALLIDATVGYPERIVRTIGHPVMWIGGLIDRLDRTLNRETLSAACRKTTGFIAVFIIVAAAAGAGFAIERVLLFVPFGFLGVSLFASTLIAQRSLYQHVARVAEAIEHKGIDAARESVSHIVGRDTDVLDEAGVARAAIESLAENFSDGVVAPVFWLAFGGLAGGAAYKAINTADSMIGHRTSRHGKFGFAAARLDDLVNLPASRLCALLLIAAAALGAKSSGLEAWRAVLRDARHHSSPNAGYPEAATAGALGLALAGPRSYCGVPVEEPTMGQGRRNAGVADIRAALTLYRRADLILIVIVAAFAAAVIWPLAFA
jgi:adenosylcobinamide-phosphate synthase